MLDGHRFKFPVITEEGLKVALETTQLIVGLATPFINGVTETVDGKEVPEFGVKETELIVEDAVPFQPLKFH